MENCVIVIKGQSQYDSLRFFSDRLKDDMEKSGCEVLFLDFSDEKRALDDLKTYSRRKVDAVISYNGIGISYAADYLNVPFYALMVDHPLYHSKRLSHPGVELHVAVVDKDHETYIRKYMTGIKDIFMLPHGASYPGNWIPYRERKTDVLFMGTYCAPELILRQMETQYTPQLFQLAKEIVGRMLTEPALCEEEAVTGCLIEGGLEKMLHLVPNFMQAMPEIDGIVRSYTRQQVIGILVDNGIPVHVYGTGWETFKCKHPENLMIHPGVDFCESLNRMADTRIVLNIMPGFKQGSHERVFSAGACKSVCLTDRSTYNEENFTDGKDLVFYDMHHLQELPDLVKKILKDDNLAETIAESGYQEVAKKHMWKNRAEELLKIISQNSQMTGERNNV